MPAGALAVAQVLSEGPEPLTSPAVYCAPAGIGCMIGIGSTVRIPEGRDR